MVIFVVTYNKDKIMDLAEVEDDIARLSADAEDRQMLGVVLDDEFWQDCAQIRAKLTKLGPGGKHLWKEWNKLMLGVDGAPEMLIPESMGGYKDNELESATESQFNSDFKPFKDDPIWEDGLEPHVEMDNAQLFIHNAQLQDGQDSQLETLHTSVKTQRHMANTINSHLNEDAIILEDLESQVDRARGRVNQARGRLGDFQRRSRNSPWLWREWLIIVGLIAVLMLLLKL